MSALSAHSASRFAHTALSKRCRIRPYGCKEMWCAPGECALYVEYPDGMAGPA
ncbi:hypothetical protein THAOC_23086, partial [Thalassiosira oceanica]